MLVIFLRHSLHILEQMSLIDVYEYTRSFIVSTFEGIHVAVVQILTANLEILHMAGIKLNKIWKRYHIVNKMTLGIRFKPFTFYTIALHLPLHQMASRRIRKLLPTVEILIMR